RDLISRLRTRCVADRRSPACLRTPLIGPGGRDLRALGRSPCPGRWLRANRRVRHACLNGPRRAIGSLRLAERQRAALPGDQLMTKITQFWRRWLPGAKHGIASGVAVFGSPGFQKDPGRLAELLADCRTLRGWADEHGFHLDDSPKSLY